ncbi:MAG: hypothetical protein E4H14_19430 [Candidatus Thorarchaeota archaeon]|nr:MAG: hypothetical protein E4H14_19430 [Candidatus Thorarchaeota archaeon]
MKQSTTGILVLIGGLMMCGIGLGTGIAGSRYGIDWNMAEIILYTTIGICSGVGGVIITVLGLFLFDTS